LQACFTFTIQADAGAFFNTRRNFDRQVFFLLRPSLTLAAAAGVIDDLTGPVAAGTRPLNRKEALLRSDFACALTG
jgi:hypothetical protein